MKDRLQDFLKYQGLTSSGLADIIGVQRSSISHILTGRNKPGFDFIQKLIERFPDLNIEWLITGKGSMIKQKMNSGMNLFSSQEKPIPENKGEREPEVNNSDDNVERNEITNSEKDKHMVDDQEKDIDPKRLNGSKNIDRIVIFYHDGTFQSFSSA